MGKRGGEGQSLRIGGKGEKCCSGNDFFCCNWRKVNSAGDDGSKAYLMRLLKLLLTVEHITWNDLF